MTFWVCSANSRVGEMTRAWVSFVFVLILERTPMEKTAVLPARSGEARQRYLDTDRAVISPAHSEVESSPVPLCDCAITSRPDMMGLMARCCTAEGLSNP